MFEFLLAIAVFLAAHIIPPATGLRKKMVARFGERAYVIAYSFLSVVLLSWMISAALRAPYQQLWGTAIWQVWLPVTVMPIAIWLLVSGLAEPNPLSISLARRDGETSLGLAAQITRHPVLWGFFLWALSHIPVNGDLVSLILFGGLALLAAGGVFLVDKRAHRRLGRQRWQELAQNAPVTPLLGLLSRRIKLRIGPRALLWLAVSLGLYLWILFSLHTAIIGVDPIATLG